MRLEVLYWHNQMQFQYKWPWFTYAGFQMKSFISPAWMQAPSCVSMVSYETLIVFVKSEHQKRTRMGLIISFDCFKTNWSAGMLQNTQKAELERLSVNHPLQESHITYSLRNCDTEVSSWFEINNILFPVSKTDTVQIYHFLGKGLCSIPLRILFFLFSISI